LQVLEHCRVQGLVQALPIGGAQIILQIKRVELARAAFT
jgi:hypothetical protein